MNIKDLQIAAGHTGNAIESLLLGLIHFVEAAAPVAEVVGAAVGQPEVAVAAKLAAQVATAADAGLTAKLAQQQSDAQNSVMPVTVDAMDSNKAAYIKTTLKV